MIIDIVSIIGIIIIVLLTAVSVMMNPFFRKIDVCAADDVPAAGDSSPLPSVTVLVMAHNNAKALDEHLPIILTQDYAPGFEVVVVGEQGDTTMETAVAQFGRCKNLYATYVPKRSLFMSKSKLSVALGVKAAHNEWIVLLDSESMPTSDMWLMSLAKRMTADTNLVIGYSNYTDDTPCSYRFRRLLADCYLLRKAQHATAYRANGTNIAFRRSEFIANDGYRGNLQYVNGEYDFIVNKYARRGATRTALDSDATVRESKPTRKTWNDRNICYHHIRRYMERSLPIRLLYNTDALLMYANYTAIVAGALLAAMTQRWLLLAVAIAALLTTVVLRSILAARTFRLLGEDLPAWKAVPYELAQPWHAMATHIRYAKADKADFTTHKL